MSQKKYQRTRVKICGITRALDAQIVQPHLDRLIDGCVELQDKGVLDLAPVDVLQVRLEVHLVIRVLTGRDPQNPAAASGIVSALVPTPEQQPESPRTGR